MGISYTEAMRAANGLVQMSKTAAPDLNDWQRAGLGGLGGGLLGYGLASALNPSMSTRGKILAALLGAGGGAAAGYRYLPGYRAEAAAGEGGGEDNAGAAAAAASAAAKGGAGADGKDGKDAAPAQDGGGAGGGAAPAPAPAAQEDEGMGTGTKVGLTAGGAAGGAAAAYAAYKAAQKRRRGSGSGSSPAALLPGGGPDGGPSGGPSPRPQLPGGGGPDPAVSDAIVAAGGRIPNPQVSYVQALEVARQGAAGGDGGKKRAPTAPFSAVNADVLDRMGVPRDEDIRQRFLITAERNRLIQKHPERAERIRAEDRRIQENMLRFYRELYGGAEAPASPQAKVGPNGRLPLPGAGGGDGGANLPATRNLPALRGPSGLTATGPAYSAYPGGALDRKVQRMYNPYGAPRDYGKLRRALRYGAGIGGLGVAAKTLYDGFNRIREEW